MAQQRVPLGAIFAFLAGAATGVAAGMLTEKKNREKAAHFANDLKEKAFEKANLKEQKPTEKAQIVASDIREEAKKGKEKLDEKFEELKEERS